MQKILLTDTEQGEPFHDKVMKVHDHLKHSAEEAQKLFPFITSPSQRTALQQTRKAHKAHIQKLYGISKNDPDAIPTELSTNHEQLAKNRLHEYTSNQIRTQTTKTFLTTVADNADLAKAGINLAFKNRVLCI